MLARVRLHQCHSAQFCKKRIHEKIKKKKLSLVWRFFSKKLLLVAEGVPDVANSVGTAPAARSFGMPPTEERWALGQAEYLTRVIHPRSGGQATWARHPKKSEARKSPSPRKPKPTVVKEPEPEPEPEPEEEEEEPEPPAPAPAAAPTPAPASPPEKKIVRRRKEKKKLEMPSKWWQTTYMQPPSDYDDDGSPDGLSGSGAAGGSGGGDKTRGPGRYFFGIWYDDDHPHVPINGSPPPPSKRPLCYSPTSPFALDGNEWRKASALALTDEIADAAPALLTAVRLRLRVTKKGLVQCSQLRPYTMAPAPAEASSKSKPRSPDMMGGQRLHASPPYSEYWRSPRPRARPPPPASALRPPRLKPPVKPPPAGIWGETPPAREVREIGEPPTSPQPWRWKTPRKGSRSTPHSPSTMSLERGECSYSHISPAASRPVGSAPAGDMSGKTVDMQDEGGGRLLEGERGDGSAVDGAHDHAAAVRARAKSARDARANPERASREGMPPKGAAAGASTSKTARGPMAAPGLSRGGKQKGGGAPGAGGKGKGSAGGGRAARESVPSAAAAHADANDDEPIAANAPTAAFAPTPADARILANAPTPANAPEAANEEATTAPIDQTIANETPATPEPPAPAPQPPAVPAAREAGASPELTKSSRMSDRSSRRTRSPAAASKNKREVRGAMATERAGSPTLHTHLTLAVEKAEAAQSDFDKLATHCAVCAAAPPAGGMHVHSCNGCGLVHYCSRACQMRAWEMHAASCGNPLPTEEKLLSHALPDEAIGALREFGYAFPMLADAALSRLVEYTDAASEWHEDDHTRLVDSFTGAGGFECVIGLMSTRPSEVAVQAQCCYAISGMCTSERSCRRASDAGAFPALSAAMGTFGRDAAVLHWAATAILRLTHDSATRAYTAIAAGVEEALRVPISDRLLRQRMSADVKEKVTLAHRWLAFHAKLIADTRSRQRVEHSDELWPGAPPRSSPSGQEAAAVGPPAMPSELSVASIELSAAHD